MGVLVTAGVVLLSLAAILILGIIFFSFLKYIKKQYYPHWKFPDYVSVGYAEYLYHKFIKKDLKS